MQPNIQKRTRRLSKIIPLSSRRIEPRMAIAVATSAGLEILQLGEITRCTADGNYCEIICRNGRSILASKTLKAVELAIGSILSDGTPSFFRPHQSHLIRLRDIQTVGTDFLTLEDGSEIPLARGRRPELMNRLQHLINYV